MKLVLAASCTSRSEEEKEKTKHFAAYTASLGRPETSRYNDDTTLECINLGGAHCTCNEQGPSLLMIIALYMI